MSQESKDSQGSSDSDASQVAPSPSKKSRLSYNFWDKDQTVVNKNEKLSLDALKTGEYPTGKLVFRVSMKTAIKETKSGQVFNLHLIDGSDEMAGTVFGEHASKFHDLLQMNGVYAIEKFVVRKSNPKFTGLSKEMEVSFLKDTDVTPSDAAIREIPFDFTPIDKIHDCDVGSKIDTLGILVRDWGIETPKSKAKRDISLTDATKASILATMWEEQAKAFDAQLFAVVAIKRATINEYEGTRSLYCGYGSLVWINPTHTSGEELKTWFDAQK